MDGRRLRCLKLAPRWRQAAAGYCRFAPIGEAGDVAGLQQSSIAGEESFGAGEGTLQGVAGDVALGGACKVVVPDVGEGVIEADALEAMIEADGPAESGGACGKSDLGQVLEAPDAGMIRYGLWG